MAGRIVDSRPVSNRFLDDYRKTLGDLAVDHHFRLFRDLAHKDGLEIHPESGGPHAVAIDAQRCLGMDDAPMSEFWAWSPRHRIGEAMRFFVKQPASAAHTYGHPLVLAEGFTTIGPHWQETLCDNLKPAFDQAACEGLNRLFWHAFVCSPAGGGDSGPTIFCWHPPSINSTWWSRSHPFLNCIQSLPVSPATRSLLQPDVHAIITAITVPNFAQYKRSDPAKLLPGYDYDVATEEVVLQRMSVTNGRVVLPDGMSYRVLALPERRSISLPVLRKLKELVNAGAAIVGPKPVETRTLTGYPQADAEVTRLAEELWGDCDGEKVQKKSYGKGRVICGMTAREALLADGVKPDFEYRAGEAVGPAGADPSTAEQPLGSLDYIHRHTGDVDIYFVANRSNVLVETDCTFRTAGKAPELWDAVTGSMRKAGVWSQTDGRTSPSAATAALRLDFRRVSRGFNQYQSLCSDGQFPGLRGHQSRSRSVDCQLRSEVGRPEIRHVRPFGQLDAAPRTRNQILLRHCHLQRVTFGDLPESSDFIRAASGSRSRRSKGTRRSPT